METNQQSKTLAPWARALIAAAILLFIALAFALAGTAPLAAIFGFGGLVVLVMAVALGFMSTNRRDA
jgi:hypothetical protein